MMLTDKKCSLSCPQCRQLCNKQDVSYVEDDENENQESKLPTLVIGSHSTKVQAVLITLIDIIKQQPQAKILIFSTVSIITCFFVCGNYVSVLSYRFEEVRNNMNGDGSLYCLLFVLLSKK